MNTMEATIRWSTLIRVMLRRPIRLMATRPAMVIGTTATTAMAAPKKSGTLGSAASRTAWPAAMPRTRVARPGDMRTPLRERNSSVGEQGDDDRQAVLGEQVAEDRRRG